MIAVFLFAVVLAAATMVRRLMNLSAAYREKARLHSDFEQLDKQLEDFCQSRLDGADDYYLALHGAEMRARRDAAAARKRHDRMLRDKYLDAASRPWHSVPDDPPEPPPYNDSR
jgi:hypothetical protein